MASWVVVLIVRRLLIAVAILAVLLVVADRVAVAVADRAVAKQVRSSLELQDDPSVHISGFPFLTQALRGRYRDVHVKIPSVDSGPLRNVNVDARLLDVRAPLSDMVGGRLKQVPVSRITGTVAVGYDDLARASGIPGLTIRPTSGGLQVSGKLQVLGQQIAASAVAHVAVVNEDLVVTADHAQISGTNASPALLAAAARLLSFTVSPRQLPLALRITGVTTGADALSVSAEARNVVLRQGAIPVTG
jgi:LmeA-like phospholipid-binding